MILQIISGLFRGEGVDLITLMTSILASLLVIFLILPLHECAHATVASWYGDKTAKMLGRQTLNPLKHIDYAGALSLLLFGFGWAKPVPVNLDHRKNPKADMAVVALAGPLSNLIAGIIAGILLNLIVSVDTSSVFVLYGTDPNSFASFMVLFLYYFLTINISLAVFNLIPVPPLDGSKVLMAFLPDKICWKIERNQALISMILMAALFLGVFSGPLSAAQSKLTEWIIKLTALIFPNSPFNPN